MSAGVTAPRMNPTPGRRSAFLGLGPVAVHDLGPL